MNLETKKMHIKELATKIQMSTYSTAILLALSGESVEDRFDILRRSLKYAADVIEAGTENFTKYDALTVMENTEKFLKKDIEV